MHTAQQVLANEHRVFSRIETAVPSSAQKALQSMQPIQSSRVIAVHTAAPACQSLFQDRQLSEFHVGLNRIPNCPRYQKFASPGRDSHSDPKTQVR